MKENISLKGIGEFLILIRSDFFTLTSDFVLRNFENKPINTISYIIVLDEYKNVWTEIDSIQTNRKESKK